MSKDLSLISSLVDQIEANLSDEVDIVSLAKSFNISPWHFQRLFKSLVGDSLGGYVRGRRLTRAAQLLLDTESSIIDIALETGYQTHESFTRSFKSFFSHTPKKFRNERPLVVLNQKPLLTDELYQHMESGIQKVPEVKIVEEQLIIGFKISVPSPFVSDKGYCEILAGAWYALLERENELTGRQLKTYYALTVSPSGNFTEDTVEFLAGVPVPKNAAVPDGMSSFLIPTQKVAEFEILSGVEVDSMANTLNYIYGFWLPKSGHQRGGGIDFEVFENVVSFMEPGFTSKHVIPINDM